MNGADFKFDSEGQPWVLQHEAKGYWIRSFEWKRPTFVLGSEASQMGRLYFRKRTRPMVLVYNVDKGFETKSIRFPDGGTTEPDIVEDNQ